MEKALRVCLISREYPPDTGFGGIATLTNHLAHGLISLGHQVHVVTLAKDKRRSYTEDGIHVHRVEPYFDERTLTVIERAMPYSKYVISAASALWEKFFELHNQTPFDVVDTPELLAEGFYPALTGVAPLVIRLYTPHSKFIVEGWHNVTPSFDHQFVAMIERMTMRCADVITSPSKDLAQFVADDLNYPLERIQIIPNPIDADLFIPQGSRAIKDNDCLKVLFVGRLEGRKGIKYLIQSWQEIIASVPKSHLYVIGDDTKTARGQTSVLAELKQYIRENKQTESITFIDRVPLSELPAYYRSADICVVPSLYDNSPYTCLEAMSCGKAVIGTAAGGTKEYIVDGDSGIIIEAGNAASISQAVISLLRNEEERRRLGNNARNRVLMNFQRQEIARQTAQLYRQAIDLFFARRSQSLNSPIYTLPPQNILSDMEEVASGVNEMAHLLLCRWSIDYRIKTWFRQLRSRPKLYLSKILLRLTKALCFWSAGDDSKLPAFYNKLEKAVAQKQGAANKRVRLKRYSASETESVNCQKQCV